MADNLGPKIQTPRCFKGNWWLMTDAIQYVSLLSVFFVFYMSRGVLFDWCLFVEKTSYTHRKCNKNTLAHRPSTYLKQNIYQLFENGPPKTQPFRIIIFWQFDKILCEADVPCVCLDKTSAFYNSYIWREAPSITTFVQVQLPILKKHVQICVYITYMHNP